MDHRFRGERKGLIEIGAVTERRSREEFQVYIDEFAAEALSLFVPANLRYELAGWARSYYTVEQHVNAILAYDKPKLPEPSNPDWNKTKQDVLNLFRRMPQFDAQSYKDFDAVKWISSSAAGYGYPGRKGDPGNYEKAKRTAITIAEALDHDRSYGPRAIQESTPDIAFTRTQMSQLKAKTKVRNVWGEAFHYVLLEGLFADPIIRQFKRMTTFYFIGRDPLLAVPALIEEIVSQKDYVYMFDWSGFDATVQEWEIRFAFDCLAALIRFPSNVEHQIWCFLIELFIYRKIAGPNEVLYLKTQGIPSGSCFTNIIGSITNYVRIQYMFQCLTKREAMVFTHGDDSLVGVDVTQYVPLTRFHEVATPLGWILNLSKSDVSKKNEHISFLSRTVRDRQNFREELACLRMLIYPEHPVNEGALSALRAQSIYQDAGYSSQYLFKIIMYLKSKYGMLLTLPVEHQRWSELEFEARRSTAAELM